MTTEAIVATVISSLLSGLVGVVISFYFFQRLERRKLKMETARKLFGGKHDLGGKEFQEAMNEVMVVFSDSAPVIDAMNDFWTTLQTPKSARVSAVVDDRLVRLMKAICLNIGIKYKNLPDAYYLRVFAVPKGG